MTIFSRNFICNSENDTKLLATSIAKIAQKGDIFALFGTLGVGKSTFSRYFIQYLSGIQDVPSPTFTLVQMYETQNFDIYHYDMYRLKVADEAYELGVEDAFYQGVSLIEWSEKIVNILPKNIWKIEITSKGSERLFSVTVYNEANAERLRSISIA
ncbi:MAG: tRNA (adenosine(37)-N6)-threonylcarbamoyltransferase complex ATPase subunit type 1 TsaE [Acetobacter sp.]|nr:tRNA (adenosine(37)-N6)-threonylcarbamoyltransferase complex ATPase subunit type 1 TsaE [Acetobacter sp.]